MNQLNSVQSSGSRRYRVLAMLILLVLAGVGAYYFVGETAGGLSSAKTFVLRRGTLPITVTASGSVKSLAPHRIRAEVRERNVKIISIVEEGRRITREDIDNKLLLVELDSAAMEDEILEDELAYEAAVAAYSKAEQDIDILRKENDSDIEAAERGVKFKAMDFKKYIGETLATEIIERLARERAAVLALEELQLAAFAKYQADRYSRDAVTLAMANGGGEISNELMPVVLKITPPGAALGEGDFEGDGEESVPQATPAPEAPLPSGTALFGGLQVEVFEKFHGLGNRFGVDEDSRTPEELVSAALLARQKAEDAAQAFEARKQSFLAVAEIAGLAPERFSGEPTEWSVAFESMEFAKLALDARLGGEAAQKREELRTGIMLDQEDLLMAKRSLDGSEKLFANEFIPETELEKERLAHDRKQRMLEQKRETERLFFAYDFPKLAEQAYADYEQALRLLERTKKTAITKVRAAEVELASAKKHMLYRDEENKRNQEMIKKYKIYAETEGLVVYGDPGSSSSYYSSDVIQEGSEVREGMTLLTIPDITQMAVQVNIHESAVKKVQSGSRARIMIEAFPDEDVMGVVSRVAVLPSSSNRYMNPDMKLYETTVSVEGVHEWLKPGMTAQVEIFVDLLENALFVPIQAVTTHGKDRVCYLAGGERRIVETGQFNENYIEIKRGLEENDEVLLDLRPFRGEVEESIGDVPGEQPSVEQPHSPERSGVAGEESNGKTKVAANPKTR